MESSRDSSVWRNLAVTFGGGLALGAVGMKLTQTALRPVDFVPRPDSNPLTDRLNSVERRLERVEHSPVPGRPAAASQTASAPIDQKVLEAVIGAVDARLHEHAGQVDRRLADLEARMAVDVQGLHHLNRQAGEQFRQEAAALRSAVEHDLHQVRESVARAVAGQTAAHTELQALHQQQERIVDAGEQRLADMRHEYRQVVADLRESVSQAIAGKTAAHEQKVVELRRAMEHSIETRIVTAAAAAVATQFDDRLAPLRAEVQQKERELAELRQRLAESERSVLDVVLAIGEVCRHAADRIGGPGEAAQSQPEAEGAIPAAAEPVSAPAPGAIPEVPPAPAAETPPAPQLAADPSLAQSIPDFLHETNRRATWRIPLVSSFLVTTFGCLLLMHYL